MSKTRPIQKPSKKRKKASPFLHSSEEEEGSNQLSVKPNWKSKKPLKDQSKFHEKILNLEKNDFKRFGLRVEWTEDQDAKLIKLREEDGYGWVEMEKHFPGRSDQACKNRYKKLQNKTDRRWSSEERDALIELVKQYGEDWQLLSQKLPTRKSPIQIKTYYYKTLPKRGWTIEENLKLIQVIKKYEKVPEIWEAAAKQFPGRTPELIRQHYEVTLGRIAKKKIKKEKQMNEDYLESEDDELI